MPAGRLRERVDLQQRPAAPATNAYNEAAPDEWEALLRGLPAEVVALSGREFTAAQQTQAQATHEVTIRTPTAIAVRPEHRFVWVETLLAGTAIVHYLDIKHAAALTRQRGYTKCVCTEHMGG